MGKFFTKGRIACLIIFSVLVIDQIIKIWIKTHMYWHESIRITDWFYIYFTENSGMAFGMEIFAKLFLTLFRIAAVTVIGWFLYKFVKQGMKTGFIVCVSLVLTGALGNIVDSVFYGVLFNESTHSQIASFMPEGGGYARGSMARWWICSISPSLIQTGPHGCRLSVENISFSSARYSILRMQQSVAVSLLCCCSTARTSMMPIMLP